MKSTSRSAPPWPQKISDKKLQWLARWHRIFISLGLVLLLCFSNLWFARPAYAQAAGVPFECDGRLFVSQAPTDQDGTSLNQVDTANDFGLINPLGGGATYNASGFRIQDGFVYGIRPNTNGIPATNINPPFTIYRVGADGNVTAIGSGPAQFQNGAPLPSTNYFAGDFALNGTYYVYSRSSGSLVGIDVTADPPTVVSNSTLNPAPNLLDIAVNPVDGDFYGYDGVAQQLIRIDINTGLENPAAPPNVVTSVQPIAVQPDQANPNEGVPTGNVGAVFFDSQGTIFLYENGTPNVENAGRFFSSFLATPINNTLVTLFRRDTEDAVDGVGNNDGASCPLAPVAQKVADPPSVVAGSVVTYNYTIRNSNFIELTNATFADNLGDGRTFISVSPDQPFGGSETVTGIGTNNLEITNITLQPGTVVEFSVDVQIPADASGRLFNQATLTAPPPTQVPGLPPVQIPIISRTDFPTSSVFPDPTPVDVTPSTDAAIGIAKQAASTTVNNDGTVDIAYSLLVENLGAVNLTDIQVTEDLTSTFESPAAFQVISGPSSPDGLTTNPGFTGTPSGSVNLLSGNDSLPVEAQRTINFTVRVTPNGNYGPYQNTAVATGTDPSGGTVTDDSNDGADPDPNNNNNPGDPDEDTPTVVTPQIADLAVEKGVDNPDPNIGDTITYTITLRNLGPSDTTNVTVQEDLPAGFTATAPAGTTYNAATGVWSVPDLDVGQSVALTIQGTFDGTAFENVAQVTGSSVPDPNPENDISRVQVPSVTADLSLEKTLVDTDEIAVGDVITFEIELTNSGPDTATNIQIADDFPSGFEFVAARPETGSYNETTNIWSIASLASGQSTSLLLTGQLTADSVTNVAEVSSVDQTDPDSTPNNRDPEEDDYGTITVSISPELVLQKRITALIQDGNVTRFTQPAANPVRPEFVGEVTLPPSAQVTSQDVVEYTVYYLASGTTANNVQICDAIPVGTSYVNSTLSTASGSANPASLTDANDGDGGQFLPALTPAPSPCANSMNPNGSVLVNVGNVPAGQSGFIRFRSQVN